MNRALASNLKINPYIVLGRDLLELVNRLCTTGRVGRQYTPCIYTCRAERLRHTAKLEAGDLGLSDP